MKSEYWHKNKHIPEVRDTFRSNKLKHRYGITIEDYYKMVEDQKGLCLICEEEKDLHVDHCHTTGKVRGLLCYQCNNGLGCFKDNKDMMLKAYNYL